MKRISAVLLAITMMIIPVSAWAFTDVPESHWAYEYVTAAADEGWINGIGNDLYDPEGQITGAQWITMVTRAFYGDEIAPAQSGDPWYQPYIDAAERNALIPDNMNHTAALTGPISRYDMAAVIYNVLYDQTGQTAQADPAEISDWYQIPPYYQSAVAAAYEAGVLTGYDASGRFGGSENMTRAQAATALVRLDGVIGDQETSDIPDNTPDVPGTPDESEADPGTEITDPTDTDTEDTAQDRFAEQVITLVNQERAAQGLSAMRTDDRLQQAAQARAQEITQLFSHDRPDGSSCFTVLSEYGVGGFSTAGENIAAGQSTPEQVMNSWMNSPGHRANILNSDFDTIGVGCVETGGSMYWVQLFLG